MSVDCRITFPPATQVDDVAIALVRATGGRSWWHTYQTDPPFQALRAAYNLIPTHHPHCVNIQWTDGQGQLHKALYFFEWKGTGARGLLLRSTPSHLALARALVRCFGGCVDDHDGDAIDVNDQHPPPPDLSAQDGPAYHRWQDHLSHVQPITPEDIEAMRPLAAYPE